MKAFLLVITILGLLFGSFMLLSSPEEETAIKQQATARQYSMSTIEKDIIEGGSLLDVRTLQEFSEGHIEGAKLFPLADIQNGTFPQDNKDAKIYVYCRSGNRSAQAKSLLEKQGFTNIVDLGSMTEVATIGGKITQ